MEFQRSKKRLIVPTKQSDVVLSFAQHAISSLAQNGGHTRGHTDLRANPAHLNSFSSMRVTPARRVARRHDVSRPRLSWAADPFSVKAAARLNPLPMCKAQGAGHAKIQLSSSTWFGGLSRKQEVRKRKRPLLNTHFLWLFPLRIPLQRAAARRKCALHAETQANMCEIPPEHACTCARHKLLCRRFYEAAVFLHRVHGVQEAMRLMLDMPPVASVALQSLRSQHMLQDKLTG